MTAFLKHVEAWQGLHQAIQALQTFLDANRHVEFETSRRVADLAAHHPAPADYPARESLVRALQDMDAIIAEKAEAVATQLREGLGEDVPVQPLDLFKYVFAKPTPQLKEQSELLASELAREESAK